MAKTFFPEQEHIAMVPASSPHPDNTFYKISVGMEDWGDGGFVRVLKIQMVYSGDISGRRSPSYPLGTDDYERVQKATEKLLASL